jgi:hypothetical protein
MRTPLRRWSSGLTAVLLLLGALHACGDDEPDPEPVGQTTETPSSTLSATLSPIVEILRIGDNGAEVALPAGGTAIVFLPASYIWEEPVVDGDAVTISQDVSDEGGPSRSWTVTARQVGSASVTLTGSPACRSETPSCATPDVSWTAQFTVQ